MGNKLQFDVEFLAQASHINCMNLNQLKRKLFFWTEKLQISRAERISITFLLAVILILLVLSTLLTQKVNENQERYNQLAAELERKTQQIQQEKEKQRQKYIAGSVAEVPELSEPTTSKSVEQQVDENSKQEVKEASAQPQIININKATAAELQQLDGIGPTYAQRILKYREENGGFKSVDDLINIKGIGKKRLENIRPFVTLE